MPSTNILTLVLLSLLLGGCTAMQQRSTDQAASNTGTTSGKQKVSSALERSYAAALQSMQEGKSKKAKQQFEKLAADNPQLAGPLTNLGILQLTENDPTTAEQSFRKAIERNPKSAQAHNQLGVALRQQGRFLEAEAAYKSALELEPIYQKAHRNLGILYDLYLAKPQAALKHYRACQKLAESEDREIEGWIIDLERRIKSGK